MSRHVTHKHLRPKYCFENFCSWEDGKTAEVNRVSVMFAGKASFFWCRNTSKEGFFVVETLEFVRAFFSLYRNVIREVSKKTLLLHVLSR